MRIKLLLGACATSVVLAGCLDDGPTEPSCNSNITNTTQATAGDTIVTTTGLRYIETEVGTGEEAVACEGAQLRYSLRLASDTTNTVDSGTFIVYPGVDRVIPGFAQGVLGMKVGGERRLIVPPALGYGGEDYPSSANPTIPANSTLIFDLELLQVE